MSLRRCTAFGASLLAVLLLTCGVAFAAKSYSDRAGDVAGGSGPDIVSLKVSNVIRYVNAPVEGFETTDTITSVALVAKF